MFLGENMCRHTGSNDMPGQEFVCNLAENPYKVGGQPYYDSTNQNLIMAMGMNLYLGEILSGHYSQ